MVDRSLAAVSLAALLLVLSGCVGSAGTIEMRPVDDAALAENASTPSSAFDYETRPAVDRALENATGSVPADPDPDETEHLARQDGRYYRVTAESSASLPNVIVLQVEYDPAAADVATSMPTEGPDATSTPVEVPLASLPAPDRRRLERLFPENGSGDRDYSAERITLRYDDAAFAASNLTFGRRLLVHRGDESVAVTVESRVAGEDREVPNYAATPVAETPGAFADYVVDNYLVSLENASAEVQRLLENATDGPTTRTSTAVTDLRERLPEHRAVASLEDQPGAYYVVRYDGQRYWLRADWREEGL